MKTIQTIFLILLVATPVWAETIQVTAIPQGNKEGGQQQNLKSSQQIKISPANSGIFIQENKKNEQVDTNGTGWKDNVLKEKNQQIVEEKNGQKLDNLESKAQSETQEGEKKYQYLSKGEGKDRKSTATETYVDLPNEATTNVDGQQPIDETMDGPIPLISTSNAESVNVSTTSSEASTITTQLPMANVVGSEVTTFEVNTTQIPAITIQNQTATIPSVQIVGGTEYTQGEAVIRSTTPQTASTISEGLGSISVLSSEGFAPSLAFETSNSSTSFSVPIESNQLSTDSEEQQNPVAQTQSLPAPVTAAQPEQPAIQTAVVTSDLTPTPQSESPPATPMLIAPAPTPTASPPILIAPAPSNSASQTGNPLPTPTVFNPPVSGGSSNQSQSSNNESDSTQDAFGEFDNNTISTSIEYTTTVSILSSTNNLQISSQDYISSVCVPLCDFASGTPICDSGSCRSCKLDSECQDQLPFFELPTPNTISTCNEVSGICLISSR